MPIIPEADSSYTASCDDCPWSFNAGTEEFAEEMAESHDRFMAHTAARDAIARYQAKIDTGWRPTPLADLHIHSYACTRDSCPDANAYYCPPGGTCWRPGMIDEPCAGHPIPTRAELLARRQPRHPVAASVPAQDKLSTPDRMKPREVPV